MDVKNSQRNKTEWNRFVSEHFPPVGAFMQSYEWGEFQESLGRKVERREISDGDSTRAISMIAHHALPISLSYAYAPRGPVLANQSFAEEVLREIVCWSREELAGDVFLRLEPAIANYTGDREGLRFPTSYIQPRWNHTVLVKSEDEMLAGLHPSTRSNIRRSEKRGATVIRKEALTEDDFRQFLVMIKETIARTGGENAYPAPAYFRELLLTVQVLMGDHDPDALSLGIYCGYQGSEPAAIHLVLFFGKTATYLFGACKTDKLSSKVTTLLHWRAMQDARLLGMDYYDLGGIDERQWPTLTNFKRQFRGKEFSYMGNIDIPIRTPLYYVYQLARRIKK